MLPDKHAAKRLVCRSMTQRRGSSRLGTRLGHDLATLISSRRAARRRQLPFKRNQRQEQWPRPHAQTTRPQWLNRLWVYT